jgi:hypothetical protein
MRGIADPRMSFTNTSILLNRDEVQSDSLQNVSPFCCCPYVDQSRFLVGAW